MVTTIALPVLFPSSPFFLTRSPLLAQHGITTAVEQGHTTRWGYRTHTGTPTGVSVDILDSRATRTTRDMRGTSATRGTRTTRTASLLVTTPYGPSRVVIVPLAFPSLLPTRRRRTARRPRVYDLRVFVGRVTPRLLLRFVRFVRLGLGRVVLTLVVLTLAPLHRIPPTMSRPQVLHNFRLYVPQSPSDRGSIVTTTRGSEHRAVEGGRIGRRCLVEPRRERRVLGTGGEGGVSW